MAQLYKSEPMYASATLTSSIIDMMEAQIRFANPIIFCEDLRMLNVAPREDKLYLELKSGKLYYYYNSQFFIVGTKSTDIEWALPPQEYKPTPIKEKTFLQKIIK